MAFDDGMQPYGQAGSSTGGPATSHMNKRRSM
jgi:hypothetical protein